MKLFKVPGKAPLLTRGWRLPFSYFRSFYGRHYVLWLPGFGEGGVIV